MRWCVLFLIFSATLSSPGQSFDPREKEREARSLIAAGKAAEAIPIYDELVAAYPNNAALRTNLAVALLREERFEESAAQSRAAIGSRPGAALPHLLHGAALYELERLAEAVPHLEKAAAGLPNDRNARLMLAEAQLALERYSAALPHFHKAAELAPENPRAWFGMAWACRQLEQSNCESAAGRLAALGPSPQLQEWQARMFEERGQYRQAAEAWRAARKLEPGNRRLARGLARALYRASDFEAAVRLLRQLGEHVPLSPPLSALLGASLVELAQLEAAMPYLEEAVAADPNILEAQAALGRAYLETGRVEEAIPHLKSGLPADQQGEIYYRLAAAYRRTGDSAKAKEALEQYRQAQKATPAARER